MEGTPERTSPDETRPEETSVLRATDFNLFLPLGASTGAGIRYSAAWTAPVIILLIASSFVF